MTILDNLHWRAANWRSRLPVRRARYDDALDRGIQANLQVARLSQHSVLLNTLGHRLAWINGLVDEDGEIDASDEAILGWFDNILQRVIDLGEEVLTLRAENKRLTYLLGPERAAGERCTCTQLTGDTLEGPAEWEQDMYCPTHGDIEVVVAETDQMVAEILEAIGKYRPV